MARDFLQEVRQETAASNARKEWFRQRIEAIHGTVTVFDVLRSNGVGVQQSSDNVEEQISCPFHGKDSKPSARVYPEDAQSPSHVWCYVCQQRWDVIGLTQMFNGGRETVKFGQALGILEREYGLQTPEVPQEGTFRSPEKDKAFETFEALYKACESRLRHALGAYKRLDDMTGYLTAGSVLDKVRHKVDGRKMQPEKALMILERLRDRIGEKMRAGMETGFDFRSHT